MDRKSFEYKMRDYNFCDFGRYMFFKKGMEIYDTETETSVNVKSYSELFDYQVETGETVGQLVDELQSIIRPIEKSSSGKPKQQFKFNHAKGGLGNGGDTQDFPARFNTGDKEQSLQKQMNAFMGKHGKDSFESSISVDELGYVTGYTHGGQTSVNPKYNKGDHVIHNHPSGGSFSDSDLLFMASTSISGITALSNVNGKGTTYTVTKNANFNPTAFAKAIRNARMSGTDYDDAAHSWLQRNQKRYGYTYTRTK